MLLDEIILIDDAPITNLTHQKVIQKTFPKADIKCLSCAEKGLSYLLNTIDWNLKTLVLVDINMPVMSGFEFLSIYENAIAYQDHSYNVSFLTKSKHADDYLHAQKYPSIFRLPL